MSPKNESTFQDSIPVFATTTGAACYKVGEEIFVDLMFMRSSFVVDSDVHPIEIEGSEGVREQQAQIVMSKVAAVSMTAYQAKALIKALEHQLNNIESL